MQPSQWEVIILKPTSVFLSFLSSQLVEDSQESALPNLALLQSDNTAYLIAKQDSDEKMLAEIEKHFSFMFRHEICRWLGKSARNVIESNFLDFLCCFKFELHSHIMLMEKSLDASQQLLRIRPRSILLQWMQSAVEEDNELIDVLEKVNLSRLAENATVIMKNFKTLHEIKPFLIQNYPAIFQAEMSRMCSNASQWPKIESYQSFCRYFLVEIHTQLMHLP